MSSPGSPTTRVPPTRPTRPARRRKKGRGLGVLVFIAVWIGFAVYSSTQKSHHHSSLPHDRSDLIVVPASITVPAGGRGVVPVRLGNAGPDELDHTVTFTITAGSGLTITGPGSIDEGKTYPFIPDDECTVAAGGAGMTCAWFVEIDQSSHDVWKIPVHVASGSAPGTTLQLGVKAVGNSLYTDPDTSNNTGISYAVYVSKPGGRPPTPVPSSRPSSSPPSVPTSTSPSRATATKPHTSTGKRIRNAARDAVVPVTIVAAAVVGLALVIVLLLAFVARRQRRAPLNYIPPRRDRGH